MMIDFVFPNKNENEFIAMAERLGIDELCFVYSKQVEPSEVVKFTTSKVRISSAILCEPESVRKYRGKFVTIVKAPEDQTKLRGIIENHKPDILFGLEFHRKKDFMHHRASGLNHIMAKLAEEKGVAVGFSFSALLNAKPKERAKAVGRMMQNIRFARKFRFRTVIASFADNPWHIRQSQDLTSFFISLGMTASEAKSALQGVKR